LKHHLFSSDPHSQFFIISSACFAGFFPNQFSNSGFFLSCLRNWDRNRCMWTIWDLSSLLIFSYYFPSEHYFHWIHKFPYVAFSFSFVEEIRKKEYEFILDCVELRYLWDRCWLGKYICTLNSGKGIDFSYGFENNSHRVRSWYCRE